MTRPTTRATTGPAARLVLRRWAIPTESAMGPLGIHRTLAKVAAKRRSKAPEELDFFIALRSTDHLSRDGAHSGSRFKRRPSIPTFRPAEGASPGRILVKSRDRKEVLQLSFLLHSTDKLAMQRGHQTPLSALRRRTSRLHQFARRLPRCPPRRSSARRQRSARRPR